MKAFAQAVLLLSFFPFFAFAQTGDYFLTHYEPASRNIDNQNFDITQDELGQLCFANRKGVLKFDGSIWYMINTPSSTHSLKFDSLSKTLFVGCTNNFGMVKPDSTGKETYFSISDDLLSFGDVLTIEVAGDMAYFLTEDALFEYAISRNEISKFWNKIQGNHVYNIGLSGEKILVFTENDNLYEIENGQPKVSNLQVPNGAYGVFLLPNEYEKNALLGTSKGELYRFDGADFEPIVLEDSNYIKEAQLIDATFINDSLLFLATMKGGAMMVNIKNGETESFINYHTGLPDDEIYAIAPDRSGGIWIAHDFGFSRLDYEMPFRCYSNFAGLEGNIQAAITYAEKLHVATSTGVYVLDQIKKFTEVETKVRVKRKAPSQGVAPENPEESKEENLAFQPSNKKIKNIQKRENKTETTNSAEKEGKKKGSLFKKIFGKRKRNKENQSNTETVETPNDNNEEETINTSEVKEEVAKNEKGGEKKQKKGLFKKLFRGNKEEEKKNQQEAQRLNREKKANQSQFYYITKTELSLQSVRYAFEKVEGINGKCEQLIPHDDKLLVASNYGIFEIDAEKNAERITNSPVIHLYPSQNHNRIYASTLGDKLFSFKKDDDENWQEEGVFKDVDFFISNLLEDKNGDLWLTSLDEIYKVDLDENGNINEVSDLPLPNPYSDKIAIINHKERIYFGISEGKFFYNEQADSLQRDFSLEAELGFQGIYLNSQENIIWSFDGKSWDYLSDKVTKNENFIFLRVFKNIDDIHLSHDKNAFWVITEESELYKFDFNQPTRNLHDYEVFLRHIRDKESNLLTRSGLKVEQENSHISFIFSNPDFFDIQHIEYSYRLKGSANGKLWSAWSPVNQIDFNFLPAGRYKLEVRARNTFGDETVTEPIEFAVRPPYWQTPSFYAMEIGFFSILLLISFRLNRGNTRGLIISKGLTYLTLILFIAFIETVIQSLVTLPNTPIYNFGSQAALALLIFPFEKFLSSFVQGIKK